MIHHHTEHVQDEQHPLPKALTKKPPSFSLATAAEPNCSNYPTTIKTPAFTLNPSGSDHPDTARNQSQPLPLPTTPQKTELSSQQAHPNLDQETIFGTRVPQPRRILIPRQVVRGGEGGTGGRGWKVGGCGRLPGEVES